MAAFNVNDYVKNITELADGIDHSSSGKYLKIGYNFGIINPYGYISKVAGDLRTATYAGAKNTLPSRMPTAPGGILEKINRTGIASPKDFRRLIDELQVSLAQDVVGIQSLPITQWLQRSKELRAAGVQAQIRRVKMGVSPSIPMVAKTSVELGTMAKSRSRTADTMYYYYDEKRNTLVLNEVEAASFSIDADNDMAEFIRFQHKKSGATKALLWKDPISQRQITLRDVREVVPDFSPLNLIGPNLEEQLKKPVARVKFNNYVQNLIEQREKILLISKRNLASADIGYFYNKYFAMTIHKSIEEFEKNRAEFMKGGLSEGEAFSKLVQRNLLRDQTLLEALEGNLKGVNKGLTLEEQNARETILNYHKKLKEPYTNLILGSDIKTESQVESLINFFRQGGNLTTAQISRRFFDLKTLNVTIDEAKQFFVDDKGVRFNKFIPAKQPVKLNDIFSTLTETIFPDKTRDFALLDIQQIRAEKYFDPETLKVMKSLGWDAPAIAAIRDPEGGWHSAVGGPIRKNESFRSMRVSFIPTSMVVDRTTKGEMIPGTARFEPMQEALNKAISSIEGLEGFGVVDKGYFERLLKSSYLRKKFAKEARFVNENDLMAHLIQMNKTAATLGIDPETLPEFKAMLVRRDAYKRGGKVLREVRTALKNLADARGGIDIDVLISNENRLIIPEETQKRISFLARVEAGGYDPTGEKTLEVSEAFRDLGIGGTPLPGSTATNAPYGRTTFLGRTLNSVTAGFVEDTLYNPEKVYKAFKQGIGGTIKPGNVFIIDDSGVPEETLKEFYGVEGELRPKFVGETFGASRTEWAEQLTKEHLLSNTRPKTSPVPVEGWDIDYIKNLRGELNPVWIQPLDQIELDINGKLQIGNLRVRSTVDYEDMWAGGTQIDQVIHLGGAQASGSDTELIRRVIRQQTGKDPRPEEIENLFKGLQRHSLEVTQEGRTVKGPVGWVLKNFDIVRMAGETENDLITKTPQFEGTSVVLRHLAEKAQDVIKDLSGQDINFEKSVLEFDEKLGSRFEKIEIAAEKLKAIDLFENEFVDSAASRGSELLGFGESIRNWLIKEVK